MTLHQWRKSRGLTQAQVAQTLGVSTRSIRLWEHGTSRPRPVHVAQIERSTEGAVTGAEWQPWVLSENERWVITQWRARGQHTRESVMVFAWDEDAMEWAMSMCARAGVSVIDVFQRVMTAASKDVGWLAKAVEKGDAEASAKYATLLRGMQ